MENDIIGERLKITFQYITDILSQNKLLDETGFSQINFMHKSIIQLSNYYNSLLKMIKETTEEFEGKGKTIKDLAINY